MTKGEKGFIYSCLLVTLISEMLLSPFYPQLFSGYFQVDGVQAASLFIICCRLVVMIMTPIWAVAAKKWGFRKLILIALTVMAGCKILLPMSYTFPQFLAASLVLLFFQSSIYLLYPAMVASSKNDDEKVKATSTYLFVFHGSAIVSGIAGSFVVSQLFPLNSYYVFALMDLILAAAGCFILSSHESITSKETYRKKENLSKDVKWQGEFLVYLLIVFLFYIGHHTIRPYFTVFLDNSFTISKQESSLLYVMPSLVAVMLQFSLPKQYLQSHIRVILISLMGITAGLLFIQALVGPFWLFVLIRMMYGLFFFISLAAVDILFFKMKIGKTSPLSYSLVASVQNAALLFSPMAALMMVKHSGTKGPFLLSGFLLIGSALGTALLLMMMYKSSLYQIKRGVEQHENF
ncbi:MFS transporter [Domibacillus epiphyticus]|uniref:MFS transporter n=1 Tax=Domibacillus epiphyticus TaxID=1714355 RepID=A0A1V2AD28_9BACI|nr:MFS transporter [Domibacillus epiphyticus]OMP68752.1 MFS transporter [Domibacillus epiphyticus]